MIEIIQYILRNSCKRVVPYNIATNYAFSRETFITAHFLFLLSYNGPPKYRSVENTQRRRCVVLDVLNVVVDVDVERKQAQAIASLPDSITQLLCLL